MDRASRVAAAAGLGGLSLGAAALTEGGLRVLFFILGALVVPSLFQTFRGRVGPWEILKRWRDRFGLRRKCRPGRNVTFKRQVQGPLLSAVCAQPLGPIFHCVVEGPAGSYEAWFALADNQSKISPVKFPEDFVDLSTHLQPGPLMALPIGVYFQQWWMYPGTDALPEFVGQMAFGLGKGRNKPYIREKVWNWLVRCR